MTDSVTIAIRAGVTIDQLAKVHGVSRVTAWKWWGAIHKEVIQQKSYEAIKELGPLSSSQLADVCTCHFSIIKRYLCIDERFKAELRYIKSRPGHMRDEWVFSLMETI